MDCAMQDGDDDDGPISGIYKQATRIKNVVCSIKGISHCGDNFNLTCSRLLIVVSRMIPNMSFNGDGYQLKRPYKNDIKS